MAITRQRTPKIIITVEDPNAALTPPAVREAATTAYMDALWDKLRDDTQAVWTRELQARGHSRISFENDQIRTIYKATDTLYHLYVKYVVVADPGYRENDWNDIAALVRDQMVQTVRTLDATRPVKEVVWNDAGEKKREANQTR